MTFKSFMRWTDGSVSLVETGLAVVAALSISAILALTTVDVAMRYLFSAPLGWVFDLVVHYLLGATFLLAFPLALGRGEHIAVDFLSNRMPQRFLHIALCPATIAAAALFAVIAWYGTSEALSAWREEEVLAGVILWPVWITKLFLPLAMWPMSVRLLQIGLAHGAAAFDAARFPYQAPAFHSSEAEK